MCCNNEASVVLSGSGEAQLGPEIVLSASTPPGGLALEWQRAVARSGNIIAGLRSALTWTCSLVFSVACAVWVLRCGGRCGVQQPRAGVARCCAPQARGHCRRVAHEIGNCCI